MELTLTLNNQDGVVLMAVIGSCPNLGTGHRITWKEFCGFPNFLQANAGKAGLNSTGQDSFLQNPFQFILRQ